MAIRKRIRATLPQAKIARRGTLSKPRALPKPTFSGNTGTGGKR